MASSKSSLNHSISITGVVLLHLLLLPLPFLGRFHSASSAVIRRNTNDRWRDPCAGGQAAAEAVVDYVVEDTVTMTTDEVLDAFAEMSLRATALKEIVNPLKNEYVIRRFGAAMHAAPYAHEVVNGSPSWNSSSDNMTETLRTCYENLARLAVLTRFTREEEEAAGVREVHHFAPAFLRVENHAHGGLYALLCNLHDVMTIWGMEVMTPQTEAEVTSIRINEVDTSHKRHVRDYVVLLALENAADKLSASFDRLVGLVQGDSQQTTVATLTEQEVAQSTLI